VPDSEKHALFYSIVQSLLYIICFKCKEIEEMPNGMKFLQELGIYRIVESKLNPLKLILVQVVKEFTLICLRLGIIDCRPIIQRNLTLILPKTSIGGVNQLDSFFPFDPCLLSKTTAQVNENYQIWTSTKNSDYYNNDTIPDDDDLDPALEEELPPGGLEIPQGEFFLSLEQSSSMSFWGFSEGHETSQFLVQDRICDEGSPSWL